MKRTAVLATTLLAAAAAAGTLPNAGEADVLRFGPYASAVFEVNTFYESPAPYFPWATPGEKSETAWGGGVGVQGQYDRTWIGFAVRVEAAAINRVYAIRYVDLDTEYYFYLLRREIRPFVMPRLGFGYGSGVGRYPWMENRRYVPVGFI